MFFLQTSQVKVFITISLAMKIERVLKHEGILEKPSEKPIKILVFPLNSRKPDK
jgi:hypothetical protein